MQQTPAVDIVIPAKNEERDIGRCLESLRAIDYPPEMVSVTLVDNGSTDRTRQIAAEFGVSVKRNDTLTIAGLRNLGASRGTGEIIAFLDADMVVSPGWLRAAIYELADDRVGAVGGKLDIRDHATWIERVWARNKVGRAKPRDVHWLGSGNFLIKREVFDAIGQWNAELVTCEDLDLCQRLRDHSRLRFSPSVSAVHLGSARSLGEVFRKEMWRGMNNFSRRLTPESFAREIPTLVFPLLHGIGLLGIIPVSFFRPNLVPEFIGLSLLFPLLRTLRVVIRTGRPQDTLAHFTIWFVYYTARSIAPLRLFLKK